MTIQATVRDGKLVPAAPIDLPEGTILAVTVEPVTPAATAGPVDAPSQGGPRRLWFGMLRRTDGRGQPSTEEDFAEARRSLWKDASSE